MGCVYRAVDERLHRTVALKVLLPEFAEQHESRQRFLREARAAAAFSHDNVVTVYDVCESDGTVAMAMQYLHGIVLSRYIAKIGRPPIPVTVRIVREVASGLAAAHQRGWLHRDIKPGNIYLEAPRGRAKLLDFGLVAQAGAVDERLTDTGLVVGTPVYMSPEQARGRTLDGRSDLFSLGVVLYELCTGQLPFANSETGFAALASRTARPIPASRWNPEIPFRLEVLLERLLDKDLAGRPDSADELVTDLKSLEKELRGKTSVVVGQATTRDIAEEPAAPSDDSLPSEPMPTPFPKKRKLRKRRGASSTGNLHQRLERQRGLYIVVVLGLFLSAAAVVVAVAVRSAQSAHTSPASTVHFGPNFPGHRGPPPPPRERGMPPPR